MDSNTRKDNIADGEKKSSFQYYDIKREDKKKKKKVFLKKISTGKYLVTEDHASSSRRP